METMIHFKGVGGNVYALSQKQIDDGGKRFLPDGVVEMTDEEVAAHQNPPVPSELRLADLIAKARLALSDTDFHVVKAMEDGAALDPAIKEYRAALRVIVNTMVWTDALALPAKPVKS